MIKSGMLPHMINYHIIFSSYCKEWKVYCARMVLNSMVCCNLAPSS